MDLDAVCAAAVRDLHGRTGQLGGNRGSQTLPTIEIPVTDRRIVLNVAIAPRRRDAPERGFRAIFDTGTQMTAISSHVVAQPRPDIVGETLMTVANSTE